MTCSMVVERASFLLFLMMMFLGSFLSFSSSSWVMMWLGMEVNLISLVPLVMFRGTLQMSESGIKYFIVQSVGSGLFILSMLLGFHLTNSWDVCYYFSGQYSFLSAFFLFFSLCIKIGVFPFHFWVPGVMAGTSWVSCLLLSTWQKMVPLFLINVVVQGWGSNLIGVSLVFVALGSSFAGGVGGINQTNFRSLLGYSSISHSGWMILCIMGGSMSFKVYLVTYIFISFCLFFCLMILGCDYVGQVVGHSVGSSELNRVVVMLVLLSLGGMPVLLGFFMKLVAVSSSLSLSSVSLFPFMLFLMFLGSVLALVYYLKILFAVMVHSSFYYMKFFMGAVGRNAWSYSGLLFFISAVNVFGGMFLLFVMSIVDFLF
nr:NADH dehydrogenase subunit 2 [Puncturella cf. parvinobilis]